MQKNAFLTLYDKKFAPLEFIINQFKFHALKLIRILFLNFEFYFRNSLIERDAICFKKFSFLICVFPLQKLIHDCISPLLVELSDTEYLEMEGK